MVLRLGRAPAKLNLVLELTGRRGDGYHELAAVSHTVGWSDVIGLEPLPAQAKPSEPCQLLVFGPHSARVPHGRDNIVLRAAGLLQERGLGPALGRIVLEKRIPTQSGLGGGSADAAAVIRLAAAGAPRSALESVALACGADVPFALVGGAARVGGVGELLTTLPPLPSSLFLIVVLAAVSTASAYAAVQPADFGDGSRAERLANSLRTGASPDPADYGSDLLPAALRVSPALRERLDSLRRGTPGINWAMTGSGGAFFAPVDNPDQAVSTARAVALACPGATIRTVLSEPGWPDPI
ncbi:MAG: 4-(cytidine 5'-diphospho)-2-C-methyl-D-erythritol kinase [Candidatus Dormibacteria bacterium]